MSSLIEPAAPRTVTATGTGRVAVTPDVVEVRLGVAVTRPTAAAAQADAAAAMSAVLAAVRRAGAADRDLHTDGLSLQPVMDYRTDGTPHLRGYELRNGVVARLRDLARLPDAVDGAIAAGATSLERVQFDVEDRAAAEAAARSAAVADALEKAAALARAAGVALGPVLSISEGDGPRPGPFPVARAARLMAADAAPTPVEVGESEIAVTVEVVVALA
ncbi:MAG TPA: SIMPL domain-containing protein [Candidatus Nanopelagicales bacterium]|nr:SIMPL domain-containing protein [Candidatus Nanopelagicales bacterium]